VFTITYQQDLQPTHYIQFPSALQSSSIAAPYVDPDPHRLVLSSATTASLVHVPSIPSPTLDPEAAVRASVDAITEIRRISGLTWGQIGELFDVDRRTAHFWASGRSLRPTNQERLLKAYAIIRLADSGDPELTRAFLLDISKGPMLKDLISKEDWATAEGRVRGFLPRQRPVEPPELSPQERIGRRPLDLQATLQSTDAPLLSVSKPILRTPSRRRSGRT
jgi:hypothetical protein